VRMEADPLLNRRLLLTTLLAGFAGQSLITARAAATWRDSDPRGSDFSRGRAARCSGSSRSIRLPAPESRLKPARPGRGNVIAANLLFQIAAVALAAAGLQDGIESTRPKVGDLESQYRQEHLDKDTETQEGNYFLRDTLLSGTWMICRLERTADVPKSEGSGIGGPSSKLPAAQSMEEWRKNSVIERHRTWSGLIAYDLETKRARELIPPPQARNSVLATWVTAFLQRGSGALRRRDVAGQAQESICRRRRRTVLVGMGSRHQ